MPKLIFRKKDPFLAVGGILSAAGGFLLKFWVHPPQSFYISGGISLVGIVLLVCGSFGLAGTGSRLLNQWDPKLICRALTDADPKATIQILQTSIPDVTSLIGHLEELLLRQEKCFRFRLLLLDHENAREVLMARVRLRVETAESHLAEIRSQIQLFIRLKERVDEAWKESRSGARLDLEIRLYSFLPFGSIFQIGDERIFAGLFWNWTSSINGPMICLTKGASNAWTCFVKQLTEGWKSARLVYPLPAQDELARSQAAQTVQTSNVIQ